MEIVYLHFYKSKNDKVWIFTDINNENKAILRTKDGEEDLFALDGRSISNAENDIVEEHIPSIMISF